ncbi:cobalt ECF transporter T component CbiQ [Thermolongibacillus altinsuensis]|uniref:cobalt ECF transporter T component CbiQ n=1 Tax=Thermolongibacillus altinsuensis TaxID=575256 RepID=UPI00242A2F39|nr:cobalt ECF transporter T component CbiQ [Thermolongibacillus altinsuensis]GMB09158.1 cobalt ECF transporter T component CbiQ [Thermolongibacillus altinsuensis]
MKKIDQTTFHIRLFDERSKQATAIHRLHPISKLFVTLAYLFVIASFEKYDVFELVPLVFYPMIVTVLASLPFRSLSKQMLLALPFIIGIGITQPFFVDGDIALFKQMTISAGWIIFFTLLLKGILTVWATLLLFATTGAEKIGAALIALRIPKPLVLQFLLTYRYLSLLIEEAKRIRNAYSLRAPREKAIRLSIWATMIGQMLLRSFDRAERIYHAMKLRGFTIEQYGMTQQKMNVIDVAYLCSWMVLFTVYRLFPLSTWFEVIQ